VFASTFGAVAATAALLAALRAQEDGTARWLVVASVLAAVAGLCKVEFGFAAAATAIGAACLRPAGRGRALVAAIVPGLLLAAVVAAVVVAFVPLQTVLHDNVFRVRSLGHTQAMLAAVVPHVSQLTREVVLRYLVELPVRAVAVGRGLELATREGPGRLLGGGLVLAALLVPLVPGYQPPFDFTLEGSVRGFAWTPAVWVAVTVATWRARHGDRVALAVALAALWSVCLSLRWEGRILWASYNAVLAPFLVLLVVGRLAALAAPRFGATAGAAVVATAVAAAGVANARHFAEHYVFLLSYPRGAIRTVPFEGRPLATVIDYVRAHTTPEEYVVALPEERLINFLAERRHPTRDTGAGPGWLATPEDEARFIQEIEARPTCLLVLSPRRYPEFGTGALADYNPGLMAYIAANWVEAMATDGELVKYTVYRPRVGGRCRHGS
jgi:hypothetical protein